MTLQILLAWAADSGDDWADSSEEESSAEYEVISDSSEDSHLFTESSSSDVLVSAF
jgi:hypothetical protein